MFGPSKAKPRETVARPIGAEEEIMSRKTFNDDLLFKKKAVLIEKKDTPKPRKNIFGDESGSDK